MDGFGGKLQLEADRERPPRRRRHRASHRRTWEAVHSPDPKQAYLCRLGQFGQANAADGHAGALEAILRPAVSPSMTARLAGEKRSGESMTIDAAAAAFSKQVRAGCLRCYSLGSFCLTIAAVVMARHGSFVRRFTASFI